jgi:hypothetical protein
MRNCVKCFIFPDALKVYAFSWRRDWITVMKTLLLTIAQSSANPPAVFEYSVQLREEADVAECLERLREALFLTGAAVERAKVIDDGCSSQSVISSDLVQRLVAPLWKR